MPIIRKIVIINRDPVAITSFLRRMGRKKFTERVHLSVLPYPKFSQLFFMIEQDSCWLMMKGENYDHTLFGVELDEIPLYGWQAFGKIEKERKIK